MISLGVSFGLFGLGGSFLPLSFEASGLVGVSVLVFLGGDASPSPAPALLFLRLLFWPFSPPAAPSFNIGVGAGAGNAVEDEG